jgi:glycosyltransferase involved in cell wall biosynthesis
MSQLRINWHSPLPESRTDIAHFTARLAPALCQVANVIFWTNQPKVDPVFASRYRVRTLDAHNLRQPRLYQELLKGINIYNMGNNADYHTHIFRTALQIPGVVILHDSAIHHFVFEMSREDEPKWESYLKLSERFYGTEGYEKAKAVTDRKGAGIDDIVAEMPFTQAILSRATGVICHSQHALDDVRKTQTSAGTFMLPLPFASTVDTPVHKKAPSDSLKRLVMFGYIGTNRRLEQILRALASFRHADKFKLDIVGLLWDEPYVQALIQKLGLRNITVHGFISEGKLETILHNADMAFNLRWPTVGEASGGILRSWNASLPALVTDAGWYADLPDEIVIKVNSDKEEADIHKALGRLLDAPQEVRAVGTRAHAYLHQHHTPQKYAQNLVNALQGIPQFSADLCARMTLENLLSHLSPTMQERDAYADRAINHLCDLFEA